MAAGDLSVGFRRCLNLGNDALRENICERLRLKGANLSKNLAAVIAMHTNELGLTSLLVQIQVRRAAQIYQRIGQINCAFRISGKLLEKVGTRRDDLVGLLTNFCNSSRYANILILAIHATERVARQGSWFGLAGREDHAGVETSRERHRDRLLATEISRQVLAEYCSKFSIILF